MNQHAPTARPAAAHRRARLRRARSSTAAPALIAASTSDEPKAVTAAPNAASPPATRGAERRTGLERRRGAGIRREEDRRSAEEGEMTHEQFEFIRAVEVYKRVNNKMFPTWTEVLEVMLQLGYRKVEPREVDLPNVPEPELYRAA